MGHSEGRSVAFGVVVFPLFLAGAWGLQWFIHRATPGLVSGDIAEYWANMTWFHAVAVSAAAAFTEEMVYRVLAWSIFAWALRRLGTPGTWALGGALVAQAALFGAAHGSFGSWERVVEATAFGLIVGLVVLEAGVWAAVAIHFLIDFFVFASYRIAQDAWAEPFLWTLLACNVIFTVVLAMRWGRTWRATGQPPWRPTGAVAPQPP